MSNKNDKELEKAMANAFTKLREQEIESEKKLDKKYWSPIYVPFHLKDGLTKYTKNELDDIRKSLELKGVSSLKKAELANLLEEKIPNYVEKICLSLDQERFGLLKKIAGNGGHLPAPDLERDQIEYYRATGLVYTGTINKTRTLVVPEEINDMILTLDSNIQVRTAISRNTEWIKLTSGLLYYYGTLSTTQLVEMIEGYTKEPLDNLGDFLQVIHDAEKYYKSLYIDVEGFSNIRVFDPNRVKQEQQMRKNVPFYPFTKAQLLKAGEPDFVEKNSSYMELVDFLTKHFKMGKEEADSTVEEVVYATRIGHGPNDVLQYLSGLLEFERMETVQALMDKVVGLMNNTREWFLKGHTSMELRKEEEKYLQPLPGKKTTKKERKIGRNEPCPCGSGKKYKKCCGR